MSRSRSVPAWARRRSSAPARSRRSTRSSTRRSGTRRRRARRSSCRERRLGHQVRPRRARRFVAVFNPGSRRRMVWSLRSSYPATRAIPAESTVPGRSADTSRTVGDHRSPPPAIGAAPPPPRAEPRATDPRPRSQPRHRKPHESLPQGESQSEPAENEHDAWESAPSRPRVSRKTLDTRRTTHSHAITSRAFLGSFL